MKKKKTLHSNTFTRNTWVGTVFIEFILIASNPLYVMVYSNREKVHLWNGNVQVYALIGRNVIAVLEASV